MDTYVRCLPIPYRTFPQNQSNYAQNPMRRSVFLLALILAGCQGGSDAPVEGSVSATPVDFTMSEASEGWFTQNGDGEFIVFGRHDSMQNVDVLMVVEETESGWSSPEPLPFSGEYNDRGARFYPNLDGLLFSSDRPLPGESESGDFNLWVVVHDGVEWLVPEPMMFINSDADDFHSSITADGTVYFASDREGGQGSADLYRAMLGSLGYEVEALQGEVNSSYAELDVFVDPDARFILFSRTDDPAGMGGDDLWISFADNDIWGAPVNVGSEVNTPGNEYGAHISRDGNTLYFTSSHEGNATIMSIPLASLAVDWPWQATANAK